MISDLERFNQITNILASANELDLMYYSERPHKMHRTYGTRNAEYLESIGVKVPRSRFPYVAFYDTECEKVKYINCLNWFAYIKPND